MRRGILDKYKRKVAAGYYEQLRPRTIRERLDEVCYLLHQLVAGQRVDPASVDRLTVERSRAFGGMLADEERELHASRLDALAALAAGDDQDALPGTPCLLVWLPYTT